MDLGMSGDRTLESGPCATEPPVSPTSIVSLSPISHPLGLYRVTELSWLLGLKVVPL